MFPSANRRDIKSNLPKARETHKQAGDYRENTWQACVHCGNDEGN